ncbi:MAG: monovalent cation:H+ antiporter, CPA1 (nhx1) [Watsoniomyces obsoletus]|nr:MAG: monovalent cation:H+ antiporter, CPA1 (nhx1) [Watsoniomyces obsoletus]
MYQSHALPRPSPDRNADESNTRRSSIMTSGQPLHPSLPATSPVRGHFPSNIMSTNSAYEAHPHHPPTPATLPVPPGSSSAMGRHAPTSPTNNRPGVNGSAGYHFPPPLQPPPPLSSSTRPPIRDKPGSTYYDPTLDHGDSYHTSWSSYSERNPLPPPQPPRWAQAPSPNLTQRRESYQYPSEATSEINPVDGHPRSPVPPLPHYPHLSPSSHSTTHSQPPPDRLASISQSPIKPPTTSTTRESPGRYHEYTTHPAERGARPGSARSPTMPAEVSRDVTQIHVVADAERTTQMAAPRHDRTPNPMAFSSILSDANTEPRGSPPSTFTPMPAVIRETRQSIKPAAVRETSPHRHHIPPVASTLPPPPPPLAPSTQAPSELSTTTTTTMESPTPAWLLRRRHDTRSRESRKTASPARPVQSGRVNSRSSRTRRAQAQADKADPDEVVQERENAPTMSKPPSPAEIQPARRHATAKAPTKSRRSGPPVTTKRHESELSEPDVASPAPPPAFQPPRSRAREPRKSTLAATSSEKRRTAARPKPAAPLSDLDIPEFEGEKVKFRLRVQKRKAEVDDGEVRKRKRRRTAVADKLAGQLRRQVEAGESRFHAHHAPEVNAEVQQQELREEKERKKDMQRKRRREKTMQTEVQKRDEALERAQHAADEAERVRFVQEAQRAEKKAKATRNILQRGSVTAADDGENKELREVAPLAPNLAPGTMGFFDTAPMDTSMDATGLDPEPPSKKQRSGRTRPRKSKEQKQAEKDAAEAAHAAMENNEPLENVPGARAHRDNDRRETLRRETTTVVETTKEATPAFVPYVSRGYHQIYEQIWRDTARKDISRVFRMKETSMANKTANLRKTAQLACKETRRWQARTNKSMKDVQARAKRTMREMMSFWKQNEREERDLRRLAERQELEMAKKAEAAREANRQRRKLNFLISQTELYSHFIGRKIKTDEVERSTDDAEVAAATGVTATIAPGPSSVPAETLPALENAPAAKVTDFENLDFDDEDESKLQAIAAANAQSAIKEAQDKARAFDAQTARTEGQNGNAEEGEDELNFQNPTSLGDVNVSQPKMLTAQLKEYQLKGLNWLVNLYEQGINGILADEMGLGKTVQSISVMAYLAENHNIWGPFLVVAPASTLHNWEQELSRFVPDLKVVPYWGSAKDRKVLRSYWDRTHLAYTRESKFHVTVTSYQLVVQDARYFQKMKWQYMILDEAQAIKSSQSSRWKSLLGFHCRNRLLLTGTPIQNNMQELWALLHFIMPSLFDSHDEFSDWFSKDIESHAQSNTKLNEDQLKRLHMILKPFMLRRIKKHVQKELGDKIEEDVYCDLTYRQRAYYANLRNRVSISELMKAATGEDQDSATLMNLVMQCRKVCNHPDLFERAETTSPFAMAHFAETASFLREGPFVHVGYSTRSRVEYKVPRLLYRGDGRLDLPDRNSPQVGFRGKYLNHLMNIWTPENIKKGDKIDGAFSWLRFVGQSASEVSTAFHSDLFSRAVNMDDTEARLARMKVVYDGDEDGAFFPADSLLHVVARNNLRPVVDANNEGVMRNLFNISADNFNNSGLRQMEQCARPAAQAPPVELVCSNRGAINEMQHIRFNSFVRRSLYPLSEVEERQLVEMKVDPTRFPRTRLLPPPLSEKSRYTNIRVPSMQRFVTDCGKLAQLDKLLRQLKEGGHRVLLYFQMTRMIDLMEEYLTHRNYKYLRLDGSTKLEDRRDTVHDFQTRPDVFVFLLSTRAGGLGINLTAADTVIFYDSDWNPTIDSQAMDRAHRLGQTRQVTVYRMITRGTIEEQIRKRALQKEEVQRVVISGGSGAGVDFNTRSREIRTKDIAMWLADDDQAAEIERREAEIAAAEAKEQATGKKKQGKKRKAAVSLEEMYHEGEGHFDDGSNKPSGAATPSSPPDATSTGGGLGGAAGARRGGNKKGGGGGGANRGGANGGVATGGGHRAKRARTSK